MMAQHPHFSLYGALAFPEAAMADLLGAEIPHQRALLAREPGRIIFWAEQLAAQGAL